MEPETRQIAPSEPHSTVSMLRVILAVEGEVYGVDAVVSWKLNPKRFPSVLLTSLAVQVYLGSCWLLQLASPIPVSVNCFAAGSGAGEEGERVAGMSGAETCYSSEWCE